MKKVKIKILDRINDPVLMGYLVTIADINLLRSELYQAESNIITKFKKSGELLHRFDHLYNEFVGLECALSQYSLNFDRNNPIQNLDKASEIYLSVLLGSLNNYSYIFINERGGIMIPIDKDGNNLFEILEEYDVKKIEYLHKETSYQIRKNSKYLILENGPKLMNEAMLYIGQNIYSYVANLILFDKKELEEIFKEYVNEGGESVYVYTTGGNTEQMYEYSNAAIKAGIKKFEFYFVHSIDSFIEKFINWLKDKENITVKILNSEK